jgi:hypothetical protein
MALPDYLPQPVGARHSTAQAITSYLGEAGILLPEVYTRTGLKRTVRDHLRVASRRDEIARVMKLWREVHYLGRGQHDPIGRRSIRLHYYLDLPALRAVPHPWIPAAAVTVRFCLPGGLPDSLGLDSPMQALEIARCFAADDLRANIQDFTPAVLREVVRRIRDGQEWAKVIRGRVQWRPLWLLTYSDPGVGHDGGLYRGAGAQFICEARGGKHLWGWPLVEGKEGAA